MSLAATGMGWEGVKHERERQDYTLVGLALLNLTNLLADGNQRIHKAVQLSLHGHIYSVRSGALEIAEISLHRLHIMAQ